MKITKRQLHRLQACTEQVNLFTTEWPDGCEVNQANALRAIELGLDIDFLARKVLTDDNLAEYNKVRDQAQAKYDKACDQAWAEYKKVRDQAQAEYNKVRDQAWAEYDKACAPAWAEYKKVRDPAWAEYNKACAMAFVRLWD